MAPMKQKNNNSSSNYYAAGQDVLRQANILASCYSGPSGIPEVPSTGLPSPPSSPPLAAINTSTNELALTPKPRKSLTADQSTGRRRGGATLRIREECERFFCETLRAMFLGERNEAMHGSIMTARVFNNNHNNMNTTTYDQQMTPPDDDYPVQQVMGGGHHMPVARETPTTTYGTIPAWLEIWDYVGGSSFRGFIAEDLSLCTKTLYVFFDSHVMSRDLKQALVALIELAEGPLDCSHMVIAIERSIEQEEARALTKGLQWAGFSLTTLDFWTPTGLDVVSDRWVFMGMEV
ncbi:ornithine decarboxylase antizyme-domain-containing protein [Podospora australis]|uniref:Ornithine decarboxylase antizyme n=1 Tax=Podospora australis TaxID=1536484 RepID=A0AAN6WS10_9PEZI|nr:ornithine decarboxylase antizyme-domain-containing protein [Podospora australis]